MLSAVKESAAQKRDNSPGIEIINYPRIQRVAYTIAPLPFIEMNIVISNRLSLCRAGSSPFFSPSPPLHLLFLLRNHASATIYAVASFGLREIYVRVTREVAVTRTAATRTRAAFPSPLPSPSLPVTIIFVCQNPYLIPNKIIPHARCNRFSPLPPTIIFIRRKFAFNKSLD